MNNDLNIQEWKLVVPLAQPAGPSEAPWGRWKLGHAQTMGSLLNSEGLWSKEPD